jgi:hypothetical protein
VPRAPVYEQITCNCDNLKYKQECTTVLKVKVNKTDMITQNRDTSDIDLITISVLGADVQQLSISPNTNTESDFITAYFSHTDHECVDEEQFHVKATLIDKCSQQSSPVVITCEPCILKGTTYNNIFSNKYVFNKMRIYALYVYRFRRIVDITIKSGISILDSICCQPVCNPTIDCLPTVVRTIMTEWHHKINTSESVC